MIDADIRKKIVEEVNIVELISEYVTLKKASSDYVGVCPFHQDHSPSMHVTNKLHLFNCFACGAKGTAIEFLSKIKGITKDEACIVLAKRIGLNVDQKAGKQEEKKIRLSNIVEDANKFYQFYLENTDEGTNALAYLHERGLSDDIIKKFGIGLAPSSKDALYQYLTKKNYLELDIEEVGLISVKDGNNFDFFRQRIMFPLYSVEGRPIGFSGRIYTKEDLEKSKTSKYINSRENYLFHKGDVLYNYSNAFNEIRRTDQVYLFEGFMDVIAASRAGILNGVAAMGTALTQDNIKNLLRVTKNIVLCYDGDGAGIHAMQNSAALFGACNIVPKAVVLPNNQDPDEYIKAHGKDALFDYLTNQAKNVYEWLYEIALKKAVKEDLNSLENLKKEVFEFITYSNQQTIIETYLKKLSGYLEVSIDTLRLDYERLKPVRRNYFPSSNPYEVGEKGNTFEKTIYLPKADVKPIKIPKKIRKAYQVIIKHALFQAGKLNRYIDKTSFVLPCIELSDEFGILCCIHDLYLEHPELKELINKEATIIELITASNPQYTAYFDTLKQNRFIKLDNTLEFDQCLDTISAFIKDLETLKKSNIARTGNDLDKENFLSHVRIRQSTES